MGTEHLSEPKFHREDIKKVYNFSKASWCKSLRLFIILPSVIFLKPQVIQILIATSPKSNGFENIQYFYYNYMI